MLKRYRADLHIHTCLSPCGALDMLPSTIVSRAKKKDLDIIAICDHNTVQNVAAVEKKGELEGLAVLGGLEITSSEEVHVLGLFDDTKSLQKVSRVIDENLAGENDPEIFGEQVIVNEYDTPIAFNEKLLIKAIALPLRKIVELIHTTGGLAIASHVDKDVFSIFSQLGFIPETLPLDAVEISPHRTVKEAVNRHPQIKKFPIIRSSDAHYVDDIGRVATIFLLAEVTIEEMKKALRGQEGRTIELEG